MFIHLLRSAWENNASLLCVGLDPDPALMPHSFPGNSEGIFEFSRAIIDATADLVCAYKPQIAYFSALGAEDALKRAIDYVHKKYPGIPVILDSKRGDIGSTAEMYAREAFERYGADAVTVNPYLGMDSLEPFLKREDKGVIVLCRTSNPGANDFQNAIYRQVAERAAEEWAKRSNVGLVMGATYPEELAETRMLVPEIPFLVPGVGAQGGSVRDVVLGGQDSRGMGLVINASRSILYASRGKDFAQAARNSANHLKEEIQLYRKK